MPKSKLIYGLNELGYIVIGNEIYNYKDDNEIIDLIKKYKKVQLDDNMNIDISWLPNEITDLNLGSSFDRPLLNLPNNLKNLIIKKYDNVGYSAFNKSLDYLPESIENIHIFFASYFNKDLLHLPSNLKTLIIFNYNPLDINNLPDNIEVLGLRHINFENTYKLPLSLKKLSSQNISQRPDEWNTKYKNLKFGEIFN
jgi:hypothetical protein